MQGHF